MEILKFLGLVKFGMVGRGYVMNVGRGYVMNVGKRLCNPEQSVSE